MDISLDTKRPIINFFHKEENFNIFLASPILSYEKSDESSFYFNLRKKINLNIYLDNDKVNFDIHKTVSYISNFSLKIRHEAILYSDLDTLVIGVGDVEFKFTFQKCKYSFESDDTILITVQEPSAKIILEESDGLFAQNFISLTLANPFIIDEFSIMPEFSIGTYDDADFTKPRPVRQGNPIISTVPAAIDDNSTQDDIEYYNSGLGPESKTIYFKIICNTILETLSAGDESAYLQLKVYLPNGLDTVKTAVYETMYFLSNDTVNNISVYESSFTFYKQGTFNNLEYVDGFMYLDVHCPLTVQKSIPFQFDFSIS